MNIVNNCVNPTSAVYLNLDILRFYAPCRANRDENNCPKTIKINGKTRLRFSSQSIKAAIREAYNFRPDIDLEELKYRVKSYKEGDANPSMYLSEKDVCSVCNVKSNGDSNVGMYLTLENLNTILNNKESFKDDKKFRDSFVKKVSPDIDLFGRMYASNKVFNVEACSQVAHAISVQDDSIVSELYTLRACNKDHDGCITMGDYGLGSALMYFNSNLNVTELLNRGYSKEQVIDIVKIFVMTNYSLRMNSGANGTAHNGLPEYCRLTLSTSAPCNHASAFFDPLEGGSTVSDAISRLDKCINRELKESEFITRFYGNDPKVESFRFKADTDSIDELVSILDSLL